MRKIAIILSLIAVNMTSTFGQTTSDSIIMKKVFGGYQFYQREQALSMNQLVNAVSSNEDAYTQIKSVQSISAVAMILSYAGGFMIGWPIGTAIGGGEPNWAMAGIGAGLIAITIPISKNVNKKTRKAVETYNSGLQTSSFWYKNELKVLMTGNGIGLTLKF